MSDLIPFDFDSHAVRVLLKNDEPWFCLADVCRALELSRSSRVLQSLDSKGFASCVTLTSGGSQSLAFIHEPNLYRLIFRSDKPEARRFQDWVFNEVLPIIRRTGEYRVNSIPSPSDALARVRAQRDLLWSWLIELKPEVGKIARYRTAGLTQVEVARALAWGVKRVRKAEKRLDGVGLLPKRVSMQLTLLEG